MKRIISRMMVVVLILNMVIGSISFAEDQIDIEASLLQEMNLISGSNLGLELDADLTRAQAATFIVKLLGTQKEVSAPKYQALNYVFSDVVDGSWYVPYVKYCYVKGIVTGYPDETFRPNAKVSEKEFLSMALKAVGTMDADWNEIFEKAYERGLVEDNSYVFKVADNTVFVRKNVVEIMYDALDTIIEGTETSVAQRLVDNGAISEAFAKKNQLIFNDEMPTEIVSIEVVSTDSIEIELNEEATFKQSDVMVVDSDGNNVEIDKLVIGEDKITIDMDTLSTDNYTLTLTNVQDLEGNYVKEISKEFNGFYEKIVESNFFHISKVDAISKNLIHVTYTHPINQNATLPLYYELMQNGDMLVDGSFSSLSVEALASDDHVVAIWLKNFDMDDNDLYTLKVSGDVKSRYGTDLNEGHNESFDFIGNRDSNDEFHITNVQVMQDDLIRVRFSDEVDLSSALRKTNYPLTNLDTKSTMSTAVDVINTGSGKWVNREVTVQVFLNINYEYQLEIDGIKNLFGEQVIDDETYEFKGYPDGDDLEIDAAIAYNENLIFIYFSNMIDPSSINGASISIGNKVPDELLYSSDQPFMIRAFMDKDDDINADKTVSVVGLDDIYGIDSGGMSIRVDGIDDEVDDIYIVSAVRVGPEEVLIKFNYEVSKSNNIANNYRLRYVDDGDTEYLDVDSVIYLDHKTAVLKCNDMSNKVEYKVELTAATDITNQFVTPKAIKTVE